MKSCATTLGEPGGDLLAQTLNVGYAVSLLLFIGFFLVTLASQLAARRHVPALYWAVILTTSTAGTTRSDYMDRTLDLGFGTKGSSLTLLGLPVALVVCATIHPATASTAPDALFRSRFITAVARTFQFVREQREHYRPRRVAPPARWRSRANWKVRATGSRPVSAKNLLHNVFSRSSSCRRALQLRSRPGQHSPYPAAATGSGSAY